MKYFYLASLVIGLVLIQGLLQIQQTNKYAWTDYYNCELNEFTHRTDKKCSDCWKSCGDYGFCDCIDIWKVLDYKYCKGNPECKYGYFKE